MQKEVHTGANCRLKKDLAALPTSFSETLHFGLENRPHGCRKMKRTPIGTVLETGVYTPTDIVRGAKKLRIAEPFYPPFNKREAKRKNIFISTEC